MHPTTSIWTGTRATRRHGEKHAYQIIRRGTHRYLKVKRPPDSLTEERYSVNEPWLFQTFADLKTEEDILNFTDRYGLLGLTPPESGHVDEESLEEWHREIEVMHQAVTIWNKLKRAGQWQTGGKLPRHSKSAILSHQPLFREDPGVLAPATVLGLNEPTTQLMRRLNERLKRHTTGAFNPYLVRPQLITVPMNLLGALWLQVADTIVSNKTFRDCFVCGAPFEVSVAETGKRRKRQYCSAACRTEQYRRGQLEELRKKQKRSARATAIMQGLTV